MPTKKIFYVLISFVLAHSINAQPNPSYIENELIIWLKPGVNAHEFAKGTFGDVKPKKLLSRRLNIWLFELTDGTGVQRNARLNTLKLSEDVKYVQNNHRIATRSVGESDEIDHLNPEETDQGIRGKLTTKIRTKLTTLIRSN